MELIGSLYNLIWTQVLNKKMEFPSNMSQTRVKKYELSWRLSYYWSTKYVFNVFILNLYILRLDVL